MTWFRLAIKEWRRRPLRATLTAAGVAIATGALFSLMAFQSGYQDGVRGELDRLGAHVLLAPKGCPYDAASMALHGATWPCYLKQSYLEEVRAVPGVAAAAPVFMTALYTADADPSVYVGVEENILALKRAWRIEGSFPRRDGELLIGASLGRRNGWRIGQEVRLPGLDDHRGLVVGIIGPTQGADDSFIYLRLSDAQQLFKHPNELTHILVRLTDPDRLESTVSQLRGCDAGLSMNVVPLAHVFHTIQSVVNSTRVLLGCIALVALLAAGTGVSNTVLMAVAERSREIGVMRAVGASRSDIFRLIWLETIQLSLAGAAAGVLFAFLMSRAVESWVRSSLPFAPTDTLIRWSWATAALCLLCAALLGSLAGFLPAWRAARLHPTSAMRTGGKRP